MYYPQFEVFKNLSEEAVEKLILTLPSRSFAPGDVLLRENDANKWVYLVESGELEAWKGEPKTAGGVKLATLKPGKKKCSRPPCGLGEGRPW